MSVEPADPEQDQEQTPTEGLGVFNAVTGGVGAVAGVGSLTHDLFTGDEKAAPESVDAGTGASDVGNAQEVAPSPDVDLGESTGFFDWILDIF
ncbi:hypothetical protein BJF79_18925 [Actinomadura sp. CNU-125]|uniref:hypothetical protein n=1 Tax=Actinomadura sp. CNU-125 TaxID=1904961 RepID=UPI00095F9450|nr:hypothetical protein [Actinomadura sp. CNU-125]OLT14540.1 hypothetical protein BJF79_18925 [Actinomadura sp. CNU-125]